MANVLDAFTPELWSRMGIDLLREKCAMPRLVRRDFSAELAQFGDVVNTRKPGKMTAGDVDAITGVSVMDIAATNVPVTLDQHKHTTFRIKDREASRSFQNLATEFLDPAMLALAVAVDKQLLGLYTDITSIQTVTSAGNWKDKVNKARTILNKNMAADAGRVAVVSDDDEGAIGGLDLLTQANTAGQSGTLREGTIGRYKGFDFVRSSNVLGVGSPTVRHNLFFHRDAFAFVSRVLATATGQTPGAIQRVGTDPDAGLSVRTTISYQPLLFATTISADLLFGVKTLDEKLAVRADSAVS